MRIIIAGGGTGGHLFPGIAVAEEFKRRDESTEIIFVGTEHGIESRVVPKEGYPIKFLRAEGFVGVSIKRKIKSLIKMVYAIFDSYNILNSVKPDIVIGVGGYASGVILTIAHIMSFPTMILEQNLMPGLTNKQLGKFVDAVCITYQESISYFPGGNTYFTGNPVRLQVSKGSVESAYKIFSIEKNLFTILVFGGSSGARSINLAVIDAFNFLKDIKDNIQFIHQTGVSDYEYIRDAYRNAGFKGIVAPFIYQMGEAYAVSDIVISRAGATTLAEITSLGKPAILIPYPYAAGNHQELNARKLQGIGAARMIIDKELNGEKLANEIKDLYFNESLRNEMKKSCNSVGRTDASEKVVDIAISIIKNSKLKTKSSRFNIQDSRQRAQDSKSNTQNLESKRGCLHV